MSRAQNIILFSSGISENNGILNMVMSSLQKHGHNCNYWRDLFSSANNTENIALLPMLIKKIPTFDFAVIICEGHDRTFMLRNGVEVEVNTMRDNVLFEIGLCTMALGLNRTILLTDGNVRLPDDLTGIGQKPALKNICYLKGSRQSMQYAVQDVAEYIDYIQSAVHEIDLYIQENHDVLSPVVIGAAASTACGYVGNFVLRTLEHLQDGIVLNDGESPTKIPLKKVYLHIILPVVYLPETPERAHSALMPLKHGCVPTARFRKAEFYYEFRGDEIHICDYPTTLVTSYNTAKMILDLDADDSKDEQAEKRFTAKELDLFEASLRLLLKPKFIRQTIEHYYKELSKEAREQLVEQVTQLVREQVYVERVDY